jgi:hypothetical protein
MVAMLRFVLSFIPVNNPLNKNLYRDDGNCSAERRGQSHAGHASLPGASRLIARMADVIVASWAVARVACHARLAFLSMGGGK